MSKTYRNIFITSFIVAGIFQALGWLEFTVLDGSLWADEAQWVQTGDPRAYDFLAGYGHPGGPVIEGVAMFHDVFKLSYYPNSINAFLLLFNSLIIACICVLCYRLRKDHLWWLIALFTLSLDRLYDSLTPVSAVASLLFIFLALLTLYIYEKNKVSKNLLLFWSFIAGLLVATRVDIGSFAIVAFLLFLFFTKIDLKQFLKMIGFIVIFFWIFDPFMWYMPIQHIKDLIYKITYHYANFVPMHTPFTSFISASSLAFISMILAVSFVFLKRKLKSPLPPEYLTTLLLLTAVLYLIFSTARVEAIRYFVPLIFLWQIFLPLFVFYLIPYLDFGTAKNMHRNIKLHRNARAIITFILLSFPLISLLNLLLVELRFSIFQ